MIRKGFAAMVAMSLIMTGCIGQKWTNVKLENSEIEKIEFLDVTPDNRVIYTAKDKSYESKRGNKKILNTKIISKFLYGDETYYIGKRENKVGVLNRNLADVVAFNYDSIDKINDKYIKGERDGNFYLVDMKKYEMLGPYSSIVKRGENIIQVTEGDSVKLLDKDGNELENIKAENIFFMREDKIVTRNGNLFGLYDIEEEKYLSFDNEEIYFSGDNILTKKAGIYYLNSEKQNIERVYPSINDVVLYDYGKGFKLLNLKNLEHSIEVYQEIEYNYDKYIIVGKDGKYGVVDKYKQGRINYEFDYIERVGVNSFQGGTDSVGLFALIVEGKKITEEKYESFIEISPNYYLGLIDDNYHLITKRGIVLLECKKQDLIYYNRESFVIREGDSESILLLESGK